MRGLCEECFRMLLDKNEDAISEECIKHIWTEKCCQQLYDFF